VDITKGDNFELAYLRINGAGAVPTLVVPMDRYLGPEIESRYKSVSDITKVLDFLDKSRNAFSKTHTTSHSPAPALAPATVDALSKCTILVDLVHSAPLDLEFFYLSARTPEELKSKVEGAPGAYLKQRAAKLEAALNPSPNAASPDPNDPLPALTSRSRSMLEAKRTLYKTYLTVYEAAPGAPAIAEFIAQSKKAWEVDLKVALELVESTIKVSHVAAGEESIQDNHSSTSAGHNKGPAPLQETSTTAPHPNPNDDSTAKPGGLILGEQLCLADLQVFPWLARLVYLSGGDLTAEGLKKLESHIGGVTFGERVVAFWEAMIKRESVTKIYKDGIH